MMGISSTRQLTTARLELVSDLRARALLRSVLVTVLVALAVAAGLRLLSEGAASAARRAQLQEENTALLAEVARLEAELELEQATRAALDRQVTELNQRVVELDSQLGFLGAQSGRSRRAASSNR
jgi:uncharacterized small protein (DUF1192 family)